MIKIQDEIADVFFTPAETIPLSQPPLDAVETSDLLHDDSLFTL